MDDVFGRAKDCADFVLGRSAHRPEIGLILGSGLGAFADALEDPVEVDYDEIPGFAQTTVEGHSGRLVLGRVAGLSAVVMAGRYHYYEGHSMEVVTFPVRVMHQMGVRILFVTNSSGGVNPDFGVGELMVIEDHLNLIGANPLVGHNEERFGPRFPDMSYAYDKVLRDEIDGAAADIGLPVQHGVYAGMVGPSYETPAEIRMLRTLGADAVGMSTVPEVIVANHAGMRVAGISCVANKAAGLDAERLTHDDVKASAMSVSERFVQLLQRTLARMAARPDEYGWGQ